MNGSEHVNPGFDAVEKRAYLVGVDRATLGWS